MRAVVAHETGDPDVLRLEEVPDPEPGDGEVLIRIHAASVNPIEWKQRRGLAQRQLPAILGSDISGVVERTRTPAFAEGAEVFGFAASGAYAELATSSAAAIAAKPANISDEQAASIPVAGMTAWQALFDKGDLQRGQTVVIAGAAGGVGHFAVQLAQNAGAHTIALGSPRNRDFIVSLGASDYVDYTSEDVAEVVKGADVAFDTVGGATTMTMLATLRDGGTLVSIAGSPPDTEAAAQARGVRYEHMVMKPDPAHLVALGALVAGGEIRVEIAERLPLEEIQRAHELSESGHTRGKIVLEIAA
ncbi:MAG TPA: NADP-dependent oxidoreductase [Solirubrobacteraceae bacterium]|jgi:NADPH:quinone reductase-like Zn-dependent oxidoreductase|nr:NADP-dependent oxidoreductase [Solirubrobacteraceae bacterium]